MTYLAHIDGAREQTVQAHCRNAAEYAAAALRPVQLACLAALAGLLHDMGKFKEAYRLYLRLAAAGDPAAVRGSVNHTFAAVRFLLQRYHTPGGDPVRNLTAELLACAVGAHHGLFDCIDDRAAAVSCTGWSRRISITRNLWPIIWRSVRRSRSWTRCLRRQ